MNTNEEAWRDAVREVFGAEGYARVQVVAARNRHYARSNKFEKGDLVHKVRGSQWHGHVVGWYSTELTPEGYAVESALERGSVQIYPAAALELFDQSAAKLHP